MSMAKKCKMKIRKQTLDRMPSSSKGQKVIKALSEFKFAMGRTKQYGFSSNSLSDLLMTSAFQNARLIEVILSATGFREHNGKTIKVGGVSVRKSTVHKHCLDRISCECTPEELQILLKELQKVGLTPRVHQLRLWIGIHLYSFSTAPKTADEGGKIVSRPVFGQTVVLTGIDLKNLIKYTAGVVGSYATMLGCKSCTMLKTEARIHCDFA